MKFGNMEASMVMLDDIMASPETPSKDKLLSFEAKPLRGLRNLIKSKGLQEAVSYLANDSHDSQWKLLGDAALSALDFSCAKKAFARRKDIKGLDFSKFKFIQRQNFVFKLLKAIPNSVFMGGNNQSSSC